MCCVEGHSLASEFEAAFPQECRHCCGEDTAAKVVHLKDSAYAPNLCERRPVVHRTSENSVQLNFARTAKLSLAHKTHTTHSAHYTLPRGVLIKRHQRLHTRPTGTQCICIGCKLLCYGSDRLFYPLMMATQFLSQCKFCDARKLFIEALAEVKLDFIDLNNSLKQFC